MNDTGLKYMIENSQNEWWYSVPDYERPNNIVSFNGSIHRNGFYFKDAWTRNPHIAIKFSTQEAAQNYIDMRDRNYEPMKDVTITEHIFEP